MGADCSAVNPPLHVFCTGNFIFVSEPSHFGREIGISDCPVFSRIVQTIGMQMVLWWWKNRTGEKYFCGAPLKNEHYVEQNQWLHAFVSSRMPEPTIERPIETTKLETLTQKKLQEQLDAFRKPPGSSTFHRWGRPDACCKVLLAARNTYATRETTRITQFWSKCHVHMCNMRVTYQMWPLRASTSCWEHKSGKQANPATK
jgi:hypothetical protein